jgi:hypothetical protein
MAIFIPLGAHKGMTTTLKIVCRFHGSWCPCSEEGVWGDHQVLPIWHL